MNPSPNARKRKKKRSSIRTSAITSSPQSHTSDSLLRDPIQIPGFHFDHETKRYFKIQPSHSGISMVTNETIRKQETEKKRQKDVGLFQLAKYTLCPYVSRSTKTSSVVELLNQKSRGDVSLQYVKRFMLYDQIYNLQKVHSFTYDLVGRKPEHMQQMVPSPDHQQILAHWSLSTDMTQLLACIKIGDIRTHLSKIKSTSSNNKSCPDYMCVGSKLGKITNVCWAPLSSEPQRQLILYTCLCNVANTPSLAILRDVNTCTDDLPQSYAYRDFHLGNEAMWTCSWNGVKRWIGLGAESHGLVLDVDTQKMWEMATHGSSVYTQQFMMKYNHNCVLSGTMKGQLVQHDMRSRSTYPVMTLSQGSPISGMVLIDDDTRVIASDFGAKIKLWDLRMRRVMNKYSGHVNEYTRIPLHVDESERIVYTAGQDGYTRFWSICSGHLLQTIPPPVPTARNTIPSISYSDRWGGHCGNRALLMGIKDQLYYYRKEPQLE